MIGCVDLKAGDFVALEEVFFKNDRLLKVSYVNQTNSLDSSLFSFFSLLQQMNAKGPKGISVQTDRQRSYGILW